MLSRLCPAAVIVVAAITLTACTSDAEPTPTPSASASLGSTATPTPGTLVGRDSFALTLPKGWTERSDAGGAMLLGVSDQVVDDYPTNVHVVADTTLTKVTPEQLEDARRTALVGTGATDVKSRGAYEVDGEQGERLVYHQNVRGIAIRTVEITATHGDSGYIVAFSFADSVVKDERETVVTKLMDSWTWAQ